MKKRCMLLSSILLSIYRGVIPVIGAVFFLSFLTVSCKTVSTTSSLTAPNATEAPHSWRKIFLVAKPNDAAGINDERVGNATYCIGSGHHYTQCDGYISCVNSGKQNCSCSKPPLLVNRTKECHLYDTRDHGDGTVSIQTQNIIAADFRTDPESLNCLTFKGYRQNATYEKCRYTDDQKFYWDKGEGRGYGFIKTKIGMGQNQELCLDVNGRSGGAMGQDNLIFSNCKLFTSGPIAEANNQRFYFGKQ